MAPKPPPVPPLQFNVAPSELVDRAQALIADSAAVWDDIAKIAPDEATFDNVIRPLLQDEGALSESLHLGWFNACSPSKELRDASTQVDKLVREAKIGRFARPDIFRVVQAVAHRGQPLDEEDALAVAQLLRQFGDNGLGVGSEEAQARMTQIARRTKEIGQAYVRNIDANTAGMWLSVDELAGVPEPYLKRWMADRDRRWVDFKMPNVIAIFRDAKDGAVRQRFWTQWENRFRDDNGPLQKEMMCLRDEAARLMGFKHHANRREIDRMLSTETVQTFLSQLQEVLKAPGEERLKALSKIKAEVSNDQAEPCTIFKWDEWYFSQLYDKKKFRVDKEKIAEYFPLDRALPSIMKLLEKLFGLRFVGLDTKSGEVTTWHPDVRAFAVWNDESDDMNSPDEFLGFLYLDLFPRDFKYGHKGHYCLQPGFIRKDGTRHYPSAVIMANYSPPSESHPSLLKYDELLSCFHELGHAIHNLSSRTKYSRHHGTTGVPRDFVEIPSIFLEQLFLHRDVIRMASCHFSSLDEGGDGKEPERIPDELLDGLIASKNEVDALALLSVLFQSTYDLTVHSQAKHEAIENMNLAETFNRLRRDIGLVPGPEGLGESLDTVHGHTRFRATMGSYDSMYYTYLLADAIGHDIWEERFSKHLKDGDSNDLNDNSDLPLVSGSMVAEFRRWRRMVLQPGGAAASHWNLLSGFLGREPKVASYIEYLRRQASPTDSLENS